MAKSWIPCGNDESKQCLEDFIDRINDVITLGCSLPYRLPDTTMANIIAKSKKWFYRNYVYAAQEMWLALDASHQHTDEFFHMDHPDEITYEDTLSKRGEVLMPDNILSVVDVFEINGNSGEGIWGMGAWWGYDKDFSRQSMVYSSVYNDSVSITCDNLTYYIVNESLVDLARQLFQETISYSYNPDTHKLKLMGKLPRNILIFRVYAAISDCDLYANDLFFDYVCAECEIEMARMIGTFSYNLPGSVQINSDLYRQTAEQKLQEIKEELKSMNHTAYFYTT